MVERSGNDPAATATLPGDQVIARLLDLGDGGARWRSWPGVVLGLELSGAPTVVCVLVDPRPGLGGRVITKRLSVDSVFPLLPTRPPTGPAPKGPPTNGAEGAP